MEPSFPQRIASCAKTPVSLSAARNVKSLRAQPGGKVLNQHLQPKGPLRAGSFGDAA